MDPTLAKLAFQVISERYDYRRSTCITTKSLLKDWSKFFPDALNAQVTDLLERDDAVYLALLRRRISSFLLAEHYEWASVKLTQTGRILLVQPIRHSASHSQ